MSSQPARPSEDKQEGGSRFMKRMKTALKKGSISKSSSVSSESTSSSNINNSAPAPARAPATATATATAPAPSAPMPKRENPPPVPAMISNWSAVQQDRARALFAKYGMTLDPGEWQSPADMTVQRIDRPIRMRVRRSCHRCQTSFGPDKVCVNCQHTRCKKCPRHPTPKSHDKADRTLTARVPSVKAKEVLANARAKDQPPAQRKRVEPPLTLPSKTGGQDLVHKKPRQRVRRFCHKCNTQFVRKSTECANCQHIRCTKCPRDPPSLRKYPNGYPGDVEPPFERQERVWKKPRRRVRYTCHKCSTHYASGSKTCPNCGQEKCDETIRDPPKKAEKEFDPEVIRRVEERLAKLKTSD